MLRRAALVALVSLGLTAPAAQATHNGGRTPWHTDRTAALAVFRDVQPFGQIRCYGFGPTRGTRSRNFSCEGFDGDAAWWFFDVRFTSRGITYRNFDSVNVDA